MSRSVLFPGQGAQFEGMGRDWCEAHPAARETFEQADEILGLSLSELCWSSGDDVNRTDVAQPGILTTSVAIVRVLEQHGLDRSKSPMTAGLSLGEYTALWYADALSFEDALRLVRLRGEAMQRASEAKPSSMTSLMGADLEQARALAEVGSAVGVCAVANLNAPGQIILSGEVPALEAAEAAAKDHGVRRTRRLVVAGGFHSECMRPAATELEAALREVEIKRPEIAFYSNVNGDVTEEPEQIARQLAEQVCSSVLWEDSMRRAVERGHGPFLEPGPGSVLTNLLGRIDKEAECASLATPDALEGWSA